MNVVSGERFLSSVTARFIAGCCKFHDNQFMRECNFATASREEVRA